MDVLPFGGLSGLVADELISVNDAITCDDCNTDDDTVSGRSGYRQTISSTNGSTSIQHSGRYRPSPSYARTVEVSNGSIYAIQDPSSETAADASPTSQGTPFANTAKISGAQLNKDYYIGTDESSTAMRRIKWTGSTIAIESLLGLPQGATPTAAAFTSLAWSVLGNPTTVSSLVSQSSSKTNFISMATGWVGFCKTDNVGDDPVQNAYAEWRLGANFDASGCDWLAVAVSPRDGTNGPGGNNTDQQVSIGVAVDSSGSPGTYVTLGAAYDIKPIGGSPNIVYLYLRDLDPSVRSAIRYIRLTVDGASGGRFIAYGYLFLPTRSQFATESYYVTCQDPTTLQESPPTAKLDITVKDSDAALPTYKNSYMGSGHANNNGTNDTMLGSNNRIFNNQVLPQLPMPTKNDIGVFKIIVVPIQSAWLVVGYVIRLWKDTSNGRRLVTTYTITSGDVSGVITSKPLTDTGSNATLTNLLYKPGGTPPRCNALTARAGRLVAGYESRLYVSSYVPVSDSSSPFPQFPLEPLIEADGWALDIGVANDEQIQTLTNGDSLYIGTNKAVYSVWDMQAKVNGQAPDVVLVFPRPVISRFGALACEEGYFWASTDGIYMAHGRMGATELTRGIRKKYLSWFAPDSTVVMTYQYRKLYAFKGRKYLRYDFVTGRWSRGTYTTAVQNACFWTDPGASVEQSYVFTTDFKIGRMQKDYFFDSGSAIPNWVYSTGYARSDSPAILSSIVTDVTGPVQCVICKDSASAGQNTRLVMFNSPQLGTENEQVGSANIRGYKHRAEFTASNSTVLRFAMWDRQVLPGKPTGA